MSSAESDALAKATRADGSVDQALFDAEYRRALRERQDRMVRESHELWRAIAGWRGVETPEEWDAVVREAIDDMANGVFFIDRLGGQKYLDPKLMAVLRLMRSDLVREYGADTASDFILIDMVVMQYHHVITTNSWIGNIIASTQTEMFGSASLSSKLEDQYGRGTDFRGLRVEEFVRRLTEQLMPLIEKSNGLLLRNLRALQDRKAARAPRGQSKGTDRSTDCAPPNDERVDGGSDPGPVPFRRSR